MHLLYKSPFKQFVKKQSRPFQLVIEDEIENIQSNPDIGKTKTRGHYTHNGDDFRSTQHNDPSTDHAQQSRHPKTTSWCHYFQNGTS